MNRPRRIFGIIVAAILLIAAGAFWLGRSRDQTALAKYKAELRAKGEKLSAEELGYPRPPENTENLDRLQAVVTLTSKMQFQPWTFELMAFVGPGRVRTAWRSPPPGPRSAYGLTSNTSSWEAITAQFTSGANITAELCEAVKTPPRYFYNDPTNFLNGRKSPVVTIRASAQWLGGDAMVALREHQHGRAAQDIRALSQLAQFHHEDHTLVSQMVRVGVANLGLSVTWQALQAEGWNEELLSGMQKDWEAVNLADTFETGMLGERAFGGSHFEMMHSASSSERMKVLRLGAVSGSVGLKVPKDYFEAFIVIPFWAANMDDDEMLFLQHHQGNLDSIRKLGSGVPWPKIDAEMGSNHATLNNVFNSPLAKYRYLFSAIVIPNSHKAAGVSVKNETQRRMTVTVIALERYKLDTGGYPPNPGALVPRFLSAIPVDLMSAKPLCYRLNPDGTFALYSVGGDGRDDGGDAASVVATNKFDFWSGRDAVWPRRSDVPAER